MLNKLIQKQQELEEEVASLKAQNKELIRQHLILRRQLLENQIVILEGIIKSNLAVGVYLLKKGIFATIDDYNSYVDNNKRIEEVIANYRTEIVQIERQLATPEQQTQVEFPSKYYKERNNVSIKHTLMKLF
ncbi:19075_t:CDS:1 [Racocetra fulgida]|uniref:19075_t:CDS:1 n=1 Tax=Racocetra fulgida TaxID=60492 RepID=A0A9N8Z5U0_9GLOM|nr:19075_t:CDS:1 [Racocetra fulgida]